MATTMRLPFFLRLCGKNFDILGGAGISKQDGTAFADEEIVHSCGIECFRHLLRLEWIEGRALDHGDGAGWKPR
ncbi:MAG: hypothetical protein KGQ89_03315 [Verrucomicrobia bacterium]|nr:hypothetical protein [Verrucomicrobiota bacterium]